MKKYAEGGIYTAEMGKPPTIGHFVLVNEVAQNPNFDKVIVLIGHKIRNG